MWNFDVEYCGLVLSVYLQYYPPCFFSCVQLSSPVLPTLFTIISVIVGKWKVPVKRYLYGAHQEPLLHGAKTRPRGLSTNYHLLALAG